MKLKVKIEVCVNLVGNYLKPGQQIFFDVNENCFPIFVNNYWITLILFPQALIKSRFPRIFQTAASKYLKNIELAHQRLKTASIGCSGNIKFWVLWCRSLESCCVREGFKNLSQVKIPLTFITRCHLGKGGGCPKTEFVSDLRSPFPVIQNTDPLFWTQIQKLFVDFSQ